MGQGNSLLFRLPENPSLELEKSGSPMEILVQTIRMTMMVMMWWWWFPYLHETQGSTHCWRQHQQEFSLSCRCHRCQPYWKRWQFLLWVLWMLSPVALASCIWASHVNLESEIASLLHCCLVPLSDLAGCITAVQTPSPMAILDSPCGVVASSTNFITKHHLFTEWKKDSSKVIYLSTIWVPTTCITGSVLGLFEKMVIDGSILSSHSNAIAGFKRYAFARVHPWYIQLYHFSHDKAIAMER